MSYALKCVNTSPSDWRRIPIRSIDTVSTISHTPTVCRLASLARLLVRACGHSQSEAELGSAHLPPARRQAMPSSAARFVAPCGQVRKCKFCSKLLCYLRVADPAVLCQKYLSPFATYKRNLHIRTDLTCLTVRNNLLWVVLVVYTNFSEVYKPMCKPDCCPGASTSAVHFKTKENVLVLYRPAIFLEIDHDV